MNKQSLVLSVLNAKLSIAQLEAGVDVPDWALLSPIFSISRTDEELSIVCTTELVPDGVKVEHGWRAIKLQGPFAFSLTGILSGILNPLADAEIGIFSISTYNTDYVLIKETQLELAVKVLKNSGNIFEE